MVAMEQAITLYVDNLPLSIRKIWVFNLFARFGKIREVYIPKKQSKITKQQFGFVRFYNNLDAYDAIENVNGSWAWGQKLSVQEAKYGERKKVNPIPKPQLNSQSKGRKWVYRVKNQNSSQAETLRTPQTTDQALKEMRKSFHVQPVGNGWLYRSAIARVSKLLSSEELESIFKLENISFVHIKAIGGRFVIITFPTETIRDDFLKENWISNWFDDISPWSGEAAKEERFVWLSCYGMPLNGWTIPNFKLIGDQWGHFLHVDEATLYEKSYETGRILIASDHIQKISGSIELEILGSNYSVRIEEDDSFRVIKSNMFSYISRVKTHRSEDENRKDGKGNEEVNEKEGDKDDEGSFNNSEKDKGESSKAMEGNVVITAKVVELAPNNNVADDGKIMNAESNARVERNLHTCNPINISLLENMAEVEVVDETPGFGAIVEVVEKNHNERNMQLVTYKHALEISKNIKHPQLSTGSAKVASIYIEKAMRDTVFKSQNSHIDTSLIPKFTTPVEVNEEDHNSSWSVVPFNRKLDGASKKIVSEKFKRKKKSVEELIGIPRSKIKGKKKNSVVFRAAIAAAALSVSSDGIKNRNRIILDEEEAAWTMSKIIGEDYMGEDEEVMSKFMVLDAANTPNKSATPS